MIYCNGHLCSCHEDGGAHSTECLLEHNANYYPGAGDKHSHLRYAAYSGAALPAITEGEEAAAYWAGFEARPQHSINPTLRSE